MDAIWMLGFARNIAFFRVNGGSVAEKSWFVHATVLGIAALPWNVLKLRAQWNWWFQVTFSLLWWCCAIVVCMCWDTLCIGTAALKRCVHFLTSWNLKAASHESFVFTSSTLGIRRKPRTKASFSPLQLLEFEGSLARKLRFHIFYSWNSKETSHESFVFTSSTLGIRRKPRTKASFSPLQLLEFEGNLARKLHFHLFNCWNLKDASHESYVFMNHGCDLNARICTKHCVFFG